MKYIPLSRGRTIVSAAFAALLTLAWTSVGEDWPSHLHDNARSGVTTEELKTPLAEHWRHTPPHAPSPAWPAPARDNLWHKIYNINPTVTYDRAFHVAVADGAVYFGSSADDQVYALDAATGEVRWSFFAGGPVRLAPSLWDNKVYVGSDDGRVYCLDAGTGERLWNYTPTLPDGARPRLVVGNGRLISVMPVRTGLVVEPGDRPTVYFCAGLFPMEGVVMGALDARDGTVQWTANPEGLSPQGYLLASPSRLYAPRGRIAPAVFDRSDGRLLGALQKAFSGEGGTYALLLDDALVFGPSATSALSMVGTGGEERLATFPGNHMVVDGPISYLLGTDTLGALDRRAYVALEAERVAESTRYEDLRRRLRRGRGNLTEAEAEILKQELLELKIALREAPKKLAECRVWERPCGHPHALILAGGLLFAGGDDEVAAYRCSDGKLAWKGKVAGRAYGLAVADGRLYASTDQGVIHCFGPKRSRPRRPGRRAGAPPSQTTAPSNENEAATAAGIVAETDIRQGYCLVLGCGQGGLLKELAVRTDLHILGVDSDAASVAAARRALADAGLYGVRAAVLLWKAGADTLPCPDWFANLVVCNGLPTSDGRAVTIQDVYRHLRPHGGVAVAHWDGGGPEPERSFEAARRQWTVVERGPVADGGTWTHLYADPGNTGCSNDRRVGGPMRLQWFGRPGPRRMVDRHHRNVAPLARDGRVYAMGDQVLFGIDAYNGFLLWQVELPDSRRLGAPFDTSNMVATEDGLLYVAAGEACHVLDAATGEERDSLAVPQLIEGARRNWGYTAIVGDRLFGTGQRPEAPYTEISYGVDANQWADLNRMVTSDYLFCMDRHTGEVRWTRQAGLIINPSLAIGGGRLYLVESLAAAAAEDADGKIALAPLVGMEDDRNPARMVALDLATGEPVWEQRPDLTPFEQSIFLSLADEILVVSGSRNDGPRLKHVLHGFDAATGALRWQQEGETGWGIGGRHGEQHRHPVIVGDTIYAEPWAYDLHTGTPKAGWNLNRNGGGCGTLSASATCLFYRSGNPTMLDLPEDTRTPLNRVSRSGCWVNIIPAGGLVLIPESSSGCTCAYPLQTSFAYAPRDLPSEVP